MAFQEPMLLNKQQRFVSSARNTAYRGLRSPCSAPCGVQRCLRQSKRQHAGSLVANGTGKDAVQGWMDVTKLVSGGEGVKSAYKDLAYQIGKDIYIDVNGWHLFLKDVTAAPNVKLNQALAQQIGEESTQGRLDLQALLKKIPIKIGGGKMKVSLYDAIPSFGFDDFESIVKDFERNS